MNAVETTLAPLQPEPGHLMPQVNWDTFVHAVIYSHDVRRVLLLNGFVFGQANVRI